MTRYDWPRDMLKSADLLHDRLTEILRRSVMGLIDFGTHLDMIAQISSALEQEENMWVPIGPTIMGRRRGTRFEAVAGRVRALAVSPDGSRIYAGTANGGVWYWSDARQSWSPLGAWGLRGEGTGNARRALSLTIGALDVHFGATEAEDVVYVGTGEIKPKLTGYPGSEYGGIGVLRLNGTVTQAVNSPRGNPWRREAPNLTNAGFYRLVHDPATDLSADPAGSNTLVAATSNGLWFRSGAFTEGGNWQRITAAPFDFDANDGPYCTDVVWNSRGLWVALVGEGGQDGLYRSQNGVAGPFARVTLPGLYQDAGNGRFSRLTITAVPGAPDRLYVLGKRTGANIGHAHLWQVDLSHDANGHNVANFPIGLFTSSVGAGNVIASDQSGYDAAIDVIRQGGNDIVVVGGSTQQNGGWVASLFRLTVSGTAAAGNLSVDFRPANQTSPGSDPTFVGQRIHADVHAVLLRGTDIWVGCDGGVYRRDNAGNVREMNAGLAVAEPGFIACHPELDGVVLAGTQDNGVIIRLGDTVWEHVEAGDGGGCDFHPGKPQNILYQYTNAHWDFAPNATPRAGAIRNYYGSTSANEDKEISRACFYSRPLVLPGTGGKARVFIGTHRIWYSPDWDDPQTPVVAMNWVTLPTNTDPYGGGNLEQDRLIEGDRFDNVRAIRALSQGNAGNGFHGTRLLILCERSVRVITYDHASTSWTRLEDSIISGAGKRKDKDSEAPNPFLTYMPRRRPSAWTDIAVHDGSRGQGSFYLGSTGRVTVNDDGTLNEDRHFDVLWWYNGNGRWYPTGLRNAPADPVAHTVGCPSPVHSVIVDPDDNAIVYVGNRIGVWKGQIDLTGPHPSWTWRPILDGLPQAIVEDLAIHRSGTTKLLRAAVVSRGVWERDISAAPSSVGRVFIRSLAHATGRNPLPAAPVAPRDSSAALNYRSSPDIVLTRQVAPPWGTAEPNEADLLTYAHLNAVTAGVYDVYAMIHYRHIHALAPADARIDLFIQRRLPAAGPSGVPIDAAWRQFVQRALGDQPPGAHPDLIYAGKGNPAAPVDARNPRAAKIAADLGFAITGPRETIGLIAIATSPRNPLTAADLAHADLETVLRNSAQIALRTLARI